MALLPTRWAIYSKPVRLAAHTIPLKLSGVTLRLHSAIDSLPTIAIKALWKKLCEWLLVPWLCAAWSDRMVTANDHLDFTTCHRDAFAAASDWKNLSYTFGLQNVSLSFVLTESLPVFFRNSCAILLMRNRSLSMVRWFVMMPFYLILRTNPFLRTISFCV